MSVPDVAQVVSAAASSLALIIAAIAASIAFLQIRSNAKLSRENTAMETHRQLLSLCIERPELSSSALMLFNLKRKDFHVIIDELTPESERALWFLSYVLNAAEQVLESNKKDNSWQLAMKSQIEYYQDLLIEVWPTWKSHYGDLFREFIDEILDTRM